MSAAARYSVQHLALRPRGWKVLSKRVGQHVLRFAFPPGRRKRGSGKVLEILHPKKNPACEEGSCDIRQKNPSELLIFGNPCKTVNSRKSKVKSKSRGAVNHKPGCACFACKYKRGENPKAKLTHKKRTKPASGRASRESARLRRRNSSDTEQAVKLFSSFHGRDAQQIITKQESAAMRLDYAALGDLDYIKVETPLGERAEFNFEGDGVKLESSPEGKQLYCIGGNQNLSACLTPESFEKDLIDLGEAREVQYVARKAQGKYEPTAFYHKFGEARDGDTKPRLMYDKLRKRIYFIGGQYWIDIKSWPAVSPGIEG